jgi:hypothetical protein
MREEAVDDVHSQNAKNARNLLSAPVRLRKNKMKKQTPKKFVNSMYLWSGFKEKILPHLTDKESGITLVPYVLPKNMNDSAIVRATKSTPLPVDEFASILQEFCKNADRSKYYIFHVQTPNKVVAVSLYWRDDEWNSYAYRFDDGRDWYEGSIFLSFATAVETSDASNIDTLNSLTLPKELIINGTVYVRK